jgi:cytochrome P450
VPVDAAGQRARYVQRLHSQYGDIVRTGPRELSINDPSVIAATCGAQSKCSKGPWYAGATAGKGRRSRSLLTTTIKADHAARRRIWDGGFNARSLRSYEPSLLALSRLLVERMGESAARGEKVAVDEWAAYYGFDVMGQVGFSSSFECVENGKLSEGVQVGGASDSALWRCC